MRAAKTKIILALGVAAAIALFLFHISKPRILGMATAPDGTEMCLVQECNWGFEPFTTSFVYHKPDGVWNWFYYDHQDVYWRSSKASINTNANEVVFFRSVSPSVTFNWATETYKLHRIHRTLTNAQTRMPAGWSPRQTVYQHGSLL